MTPERAAYHYLMLTQGLWEEFDRDFNEDPLSDLTVKLCAAPPSDIDACRSVMMNYYCDFIVDGSVVFDLAWQDIGRRWQNGSMTEKQLVDLARNLAEEAESRWDADWYEFKGLYYCWDYAQQGEITWADFHHDAEVFFTTKSCPHP